MSQLSSSTFIDALFLVLRDNSQEVKKIVSDILTIYEVDSKKNNNNYLENDNVRLYVTLLSEVLQSNITFKDKAALDALLLKVKNSGVLRTDPDAYSSLKRIFLDETPLDEVTARHYFRKLTNTVTISKASDKIKRMFGWITRMQSMDKPDNQESGLQEISKLCSAVMQDNQLIFQDEETKHTARSADFTDKNSLLKAMEVYTETSVKNKLLMGWQGLNRAMNGGLRIGESVVFNSLSHSGKSLMLLKIARWIVTLNKVDATYKNPTCIIYSLENETPQNIKQLFDEMWINEHKELPPSDMTNEQIADYCYNTASKNGWQLLVRRKVGAEFGFAELVADFENLKRQGFTPMACIIDYVNMMQKEGNVESVGNHLQIQQIYTNIRNFLSAHNCCFITAHQLNRKAAEAVRLNPVNAVKKFTMDMLAGSTDPQREVDMVFYQHKEVDTQGRSWLTFKMDKHRYDTTTPEKDKYFAYMFDGPIGILDDLDGDDHSTTNLYAANKKNKEEEDDDATSSFKY